MKEIREIIAEYEIAKEANYPMAIATVYEVKGSSYRRSGARMLIKQDGQWFGGISGGCIEGNALKQANMVMADGRARLVTYDTEKDDESNIGVSLGCNGLISIIISPITESYNPIIKLQEIAKENRPQILFTILESTNKDFPIGSVLSVNDLENSELATENKEQIDSIIKTVLASKKSTLKYINNVKLFVEFINPDIHLVIFGGNYDVYPLIKIADSLGWKKSIVSNPRRLYKPAMGLADEIKTNLSDITLGKQSVGVIMAHDYAVDLRNFKLSLGSALNYIGVLGPAVRRDDMIQELLSEGVHVDKQRVFGPAGLDIGANQPEEIAISIISEIISVMRNRNARSLRERNTPIHER